MWNSAYKLDFSRSWHFDNETLELQYILSAKEKTESLNDLLYSFSKEPCPVRGCAAPNDKVDYESNWRKWSVANDWPKKRVPGSGANVTIESSWRMYVDVSEVNVEKIEIQGHLEFDNKRDVVFNATWVSKLTLFTCREGMFIAYVYRLSLLEVMASL